MTEREPIASPTWELSAISKALAVTPDHRTDPELGDFAHFDLPDAIELDLFPETGLVHLSTLDSHIALGHQNPPLIEPFGLVFSHQSDTHHTDLTIASDGAVTLFLAPASHNRANQAENRPQEASDSSNQPNTHDSLSQRADDDSEPSEDPSENGLTTAHPAEVHPRVTLVGRLGSAPRFRTTKNERLIGRFPLAVHHDDETTTWHPVVVFADRAAQLQEDALTKGELVSVVGYEHERTWTDKQGQERTEVQIYAAVIART